MNRGVVLTVVTLVGCAKTNDTSSASTMASSSAAASYTVRPSSPSPAPSPIAPPAAAALPGPADAIVAQHILVTYRGAKRAPKSVVRTKTEAKIRAQEALAKVRSGTAFEDVVDTYSDDAASVNRLGSVGKFHRGDMDPAFSAAAFALKADEVSGVVETPFGFHVIKRTQ